MKKRINILLLAGLLFSAVACDDSENNFSESTSTRIEQTLERYKFALQAGKTWVMEYFPDENLGYGGWIYIVEFQDDRMVKAWFEGSTFVEADPLRTESEYRVEFSTGPMLKFATHNDYLHFFSFPGDNGAGYQGWKGDYEFTFMSLSPAFDEIILRGIKTGNRIRMTPLSGQYTPESYLETIRSSQLAITETEFKVMANGEQIGTLTRPNATLTTNFRQYAASKVWSFRYSYRQQAFDDMDGRRWTNMGNRSTKRSKPMIPSASSICRTASCSFTPPTRSGVNCSDSRTRRCKPSNGNWDLPRHRIVTFAPTRFSTSNWFRDP